MAVKLNNFEYTQKKSKLTNEKVLTVQCQIYSLSLLGARIGSTNMSGSKQEQCYAANV